MSELRRQWKWRPKWSCFFSIWTWHLFHHTTKGHVPSDPSAQPTRSTAGRNAHNGYRSASTVEGVPDFRKMVYVISCIIKNKTYGICCNLCCLDPPSKSNLEPIQTCHISTTSLPLHNIQSFSQGTYHLEACSGAWTMPIVIFVVVVGQPNGLLSQLWILITTEAIF